MAGTTVDAGPFVGGLNTLSDPGAINDSELAVCLNFEVDPDGSLNTRPPFVDKGVSIPVGTGSVRYLGLFYTSTGAQYLIGSSPSGTYAYAGGAWTLITSTIQAAAAVQFNSVAYLLAPVGSTNPSGYWNGTTFTADSNMPKGSAIVAYKSRLWVATAGATVQYSAVIPDANFWTIGSTYGGSFVVSGGDGQSTVSLLVLSSVLLIWRTRSIWQFSYATDPSAGSQQVLVSDIGLSSPDALTVFEGIAYFMFDGKAYVLNGAQANQLNPMVPFISGFRAACYLPYAVSAVNRRIIFSYYDTMFVYNLRSRTWTTWSSPFYIGIGKFFQISGADTQDAPVYLTHSNFTNNVTSQPSLYFADGFSFDAEATAYTATMRTKTYDYATPSKFKVLFWWGLDVIFRGSVTASVVPVTYSQRVTWSQLLSHTWSELLQYTWAQPYLSIVAFSTTISGAQAGVGPSRKELRFRRKMRFRQAYYEVSTTVDGTVSTSPTTIFGIETVVDVKQLVPRQVN